MNTLRTWVEVVIVAAFAVYIVFFNPRQDPTPSTPGATAPQLHDTPHTDITPDKVKVYEPAAKKKLDLSTDIVDDPNKYVLGSTRLPNDTHDHTVTTVIDAKTGESTTVVREEPYPWFAQTQRGYVQFGSGLTSRGVIWRTAVSQDMLQIKAIYFGVDATMDSDGQWYAGWHAAYRW